jgi:ArsR family transcriptional regulator
MIGTKEFELVRAARFQALADPVRLQIVAVLQKRAHCVCEIQSAIGPIAANLLSYHLSILRTAGLISAQRRGRWLDYRLEYAAFEELRASLPHQESDAYADAVTDGTSTQESTAAGPTLCVRRARGEKKVSARPGRCG